MNFPWEQFFTLIKEKAYRKAKRQAPRWNGSDLIYTSPMMISDDIHQWQDMAGGIVADGRYGRESEKRCKAIQKKAGLVQDGIVGPQTWYATFGNPN